MNGYAIFILASLIIKLGIDLLTSLLNIKALRFKLPTELQGLYNPDEYRKSQEYLRVSTITDLIEKTFSLAITLVFWFIGGFNALDNVIRGWGFALILDGLFYLGIIYVAIAVLTLPFGIYNTFVIEQRFGFNRTSPRTFLGDIVKMLILGAILGGALLAWALALFQYAGSWAWVYGWLGIVLFSIVTQFVAPAWIMPLFNKFKPMTPGELKEAILTYAHSVNFPIKNILVMDGSRRSSKSNAFFTGFGPNKRIALFDTLIEKHNKDEIVAILAHEIGHYKKKHIIKSMIISVAYSGLILFLFSVFLDQPSLYKAFYMDHQPIYAGIVFFILLSTPLNIIFSIISQSISRKDESSADIFAADTIGEKQNMIEALKKLSTTNLSNLTPHKLYVFINYSHPPLLQRLQTIKKRISRDNSL